MYNYVQREMGGGGYMGGVGRVIGLHMGRGRAHFQNKPCALYIGIYTIHQPFEIQCL